jgi:hypothetical protein
MSAPAGLRPASAPHGAVPPVTGLTGELIAARGANPDLSCVPPAVGVERRGAIRADDPKVLEPVIVAPPVDVIEDQRHAPPLPFLSLTAQLAPPCLEPLREETLLELDPREGRPLDEDLGERDRDLSIALECRGAGRRRIEVLHRDVPDTRSVSLQRSPIVARRTHLEAPEGLRVRAGRGDRGSRLFFCIPGCCPHEHMFAGGPDGSWGARTRTGTPRTKTWCAANYTTPQ